MSNDGRWRWEWSGTPHAQVVEPWMRPGHGHDGVLHATVVYLVSMPHENREWSFRSVTEIYEEAMAWRNVREDAALGVLRELESFGVVERRDDTAREWRATLHAISALEEAYRERHPMLPNKSASP